MGRPGVVSVSSALPGCRSIVTAVDPFLDLVRALHQHRVRFVLIGVSGVNYYASRGSLLKGLEALLKRDTETDAE